MTALEINNNPIKQLRTQYGVTQLKLSQITGIPKRSIENWEEGLRKPKPYMIEMIKTSLKNHKEGK